MSNTAIALPPAAMPADRFFRSALFFLIFTSVATLASTGHLDAFTSVVAPLAVLLKGFRLWSGRGPEVSHRLATVLVVAYLAIFPVDYLVFSRALAENGANPALYAALLATVHFLLFVLLVRLYSASTDRDALFLALLSFGGILAAATLTIDTYFLALFFLYMIFGVATFIGFEMRRGARGVLSHYRPGLERRLNRALGAAALSVSLGAILLGGVFFFLFPRFTAGYFGRTNPLPSLMTGFTDEVELGQIGEIKKNSAVVMRVRTGLLGVSYRLRWRGIALTTFDGKRWSSPERSETVLPQDADGWIHPREFPEAMRAHSVPVRYTILLEPIATDAVFAPSYVISLRGKFSGEGPAATRRNYLLVDNTSSLSNPFHNYAAMRYEGFSLVPQLSPQLLRTASQDYPEDLPAVYLQLPPLDQRVRDLARRITAQAATPYDKAAAIESYLLSNYRYTLNLTGRPGEDALARFLFVTRAGHCEYFATAMTILLRTLDIPARYVNGFLPGEYNDVGNDYVVRASDAHSWVEVYFPGYGWLTFDPTPAGAASSSGVLGRLGAYWDWFQLMWNEWVISYDVAHQITLSQNIQRGSQTWTARVRGFVQRAERKGKEFIALWQTKHGVLRGLLPLVLVLFLVALNYNALHRAAVRVRLEWRARSSLGTRPDAQLASLLYEDLLRVLSRRGLRREASQTPLEFAAALDAPGVSPAVDEFTSLYVRARFGGTPCDAPRLRALIQQARAALRAR
jgi:protein-glutamine gamma-glutamyltransferase